MTTDSALRPGTQASTNSTLSSRGELPKSKNRSHMENMKGYGSESESEEVRQKRMLIIMIDAYFDSRLTINRVNR